MGGMFTILKVRDRITDYNVDPGWYANPPGTVAHRVDGPPQAAQEDVEYTCPMHPEVLSKTPGNCPKCGMKLVPVQKKSGN